MRLPDESPRSVDRAALSKEFRCVLLQLGRVLRSDEQEGGNVFRRIDVNRNAAKVRVIPNKSNCSLGVYAGK